MEGLLVSSPSMLFSQHPSNSSSQFLQFRIHHQRRANSFVSLSSSTSTSSTSSSSSVAEEQQDSPSSPSVSLVDDVNDALPLNFSGCKSCGRESIERGCNGDGRIQGGIATIPGFGWWPIKAYRPCPGFLESGGSYRRRGQSMDEVAFGGGKRGSSMDNSETRKKGKNQNAIKG